MAGGLQISGHSDQDTISTPVTTCQVPRVIFRPRATEAQGNEILPCGIRACITGSYWKSLSTKSYHSSEGFKKKKSRFSLDCSEDLGLDSVPINSCLLLSGEGPRKGCLAFFVNIQELALPAPRPSMPRQIHDSVFLRKPFQTAPVMETIRVS